MDDRRKPNWVLIACLSFLAVVVVGTCGAGGWFLYRKVDIVQGSSELPRLAREYRATGLPWVASDLIKPPVRPQDNAAPLLRRAYAQADWIRFEQRYPKLKEALDSHRYDAAQSILEPYASSLSTLEAAVKCPRLDFGRDWDQNMTLTFPELRLSKQMAKALTARALIETAKGDATSAIHDLDAARDLGGLLGQEPTVIPTLVQIAIETIVCHGVEKCAALTLNDPRALTGLARVFQPSAQPNLGHALQGEAFIEIAMCRNMDRLADPTHIATTETPVKPLRNLRRSGLPPQAGPRAEMAGILECWIGLAPILKAQDPNPLAISDMLEQIARQLGGDRKASTLMAETLIPTFSPAGTAVVKLKAQTEDTQALLQALIQRKVTGRYPGSIKEVPGNWSDPFGGKPLILRRTKDGIRIYSVGPDLIDNGGIDVRELPKNRPDNTPYDIVAAYPPIKSRATG